MLKHEIEDDCDTVLTISISSVCVRLSAIRDAFHEASLLLKMFGGTNHGRVFRAGDIGRLESPVTASDDSFFNLNIENQLKFAINEDVPAIVEGLTRDLSSNEMHSVLYRYYVLMDLTNTAIRIIRDFNPDTDPAGVAEHFAGLRQVFRSAMTEEEFSELATKICYKTIELRDCGNSSHHVKIVRRACEYIQENLQSTRDLAEHRRRPRGSEPHPLQHGLFSGDVGDIHRVSHQCPYGEGQGAAGHHG
jgi:hypothetical protein